MWKLASLVWIMLGTVMAGSAVVAVVSTPTWFDNGMRLIPIVGIAGYVLALPIAWYIAKAIDANVRSRGGS